MLKQYKKYTATIEWVDEDTKQVYSSVRVFNLYDIESHARVNNKACGFKDNIKRTMILTSMGYNYNLVVPFEDFDEMFTEVLTERGMMDTSRDKKKEPPIPFEAKWKYNGAVKHTFVKKECLIACRVTPKNYNPLGKDFEEMMSNCIDSNIIYFN